MRFKKNIKFALRIIGSAFIFCAGKLVKKDKHFFLFGTNNGDLKEGPKYFYLYCSGLPMVRAYWIGNRETAHKLRRDGLNAVSYWSFKALLLHCRANYYIMSHSLSGLSPYKIRTDSIVINLWHGTPLKKIGYDREGGRDLTVMADGSTCLKWGLSDFYIVGSDWLVPRFSRAMQVSETNVLPIGNPKTDILYEFKKDNERFKNQRAMILEVLGWELDSKVILYSPTHRDTNESKSTLEDQIKNLASEFIDISSDSSCKLLIKPHPYENFTQTDLPDNVKSDPRVKVVTDNSDITDLLLIAEVLITDYSSIIYDFCILGKPILMYIEDCDDYIFSRGLYPDVESFPYPKFNNVKTLMRFLLAPIDIDPLSVDRFTSRYNSGPSASERLYSVIERGLLQR